MSSRRHGHAGSGWPRHPLFQKSRFPRFQPRNPRQARWLALQSWRLRRRQAYHSLTSQRDSDYQQKQLRRRTGVCAGVPLRGTIEAGQPYYMLSADKMQQFNAFLREQELKEREERAKLMLEGVEYERRRAHALQRQATQARMRADAMTASPPPPLPNYIKASSSLPLSLMRQPLTRPQRLRTPEMQSSRLAASSPVLRPQTVQPRTPSRQPPAPSGLLRSKSMGDLRLPSNQSAKRPPLPKTASSFTGGLPPLPFGETPQAQAARKPAPSVSP